MSSSVDETDVHNVKKKQIPYYNVFQRSYRLRRNTGLNCFSMALFEQFFYSVWIKSARAPIYNLPHLFPCLFDSLELLGSDFLANPPYKLNIKQYTSCMTLLVLAVSRLQGVCAALLT